MLPGWVPILALGVLILSLFVRAWVGFGLGGRLYIWLGPSLITGMMLWLFAYLRIGGFSPANLSLAGRVLMLTIFALWALINFLVSYEEYRLKRILRRLNL